MTASGIKHQPISSCATTAVILAAGTGQRLRPMTSNLPKACLKFGAKTIIEESVDILRAHGITSVVIVTGHCRSLIETLDFGSNITIKPIHNPAYESTGSLGSLMCVHRFLRAEFLLLEADIVYEARAIQRLLAMPSSDALVVSSPASRGDEVWVTVTNDRILGLSKEVSELQGLIVGEFIGISRISISLLTAIVEYYNAAPALHARQSYEHALANVARHEFIRCCLIADLVWGEVDNTSQYETVRRKIYPVLDSLRRRVYGAGLRP